MKRRTKIILGVLAGLALLVGLAALFPSEGRNQEFQPQNEFKLDPWIPLKLGPLDMSINKAVLYLVLASALTIGVMTYIARRMEDRPNRVQTAIEALYDLTRNRIARANMDEQMTGRFFAFVATLFFFIWFSNLLGYIPLPAGHEHITIFGLQVPALAIYAATANLSVPLMLTLMVWFLYQYQGIRAKGFVQYFKDWIPAGTPGPMKVPIFVIEVISQFVRIISLSVRLFANILAGHLLILFMGGGLAVILGFAALGLLTLPVAVVFFIFEVVLIATLQAFIFATLTSIYLGEAVAEAH
ncbi:MAG: F0F1 ATP synthase subunit A [Chloroflexota bacterium]|nr:F0F1 ATP synthase subunit A [Chloroflexota bacterium]